MTIESVPHPWLTYFHWLNPGQVKPKNRFIRQSSGQPYMKGCGALSIDRHLFHSTYDVKKFRFLEKSIIINVIGA